MRTLANMVEHLGDELDFRIVASDRDSFETKPYPGVKINSWNTVGKAYVYYATHSSMGLRKIYDLIRKTPHDILYLNSFFTPRFTMRPLIARRLGLIPERPVVIAPRGEFSKGALDLKSLKKQTYIRLAKLVGLYRGLTWQASSEFELYDIKRIMGIPSQCIHVAPDLAAGMKQTDDSSRLFEEANRPLRVVFLSRISPMKNLDFALKVLQQLSVAVEFNIYGIVDDESYWQRCRELMLRLPSQVTAKYHGVIEHGTVAHVLASHDLFFLPTRGENYGHAIFEALAAGVPPLISDQTPWQDFDQTGVGWVRPLGSMHAFKEVIELFAVTDVSGRMSRRAQAKQYAWKVAGSTVIKKQNLELFRNTLNIGKAQ